MKIAAAVSVFPVRVELDLPDGLPAEEVHDRIIERARVMLANNGARHVVLSANAPGLCEPLDYLGALGFPVLVQHVPIEAPPEEAEYDYSRLGDRENYD
ncbi:MAG: hypothetical protein M5U26_11885 [Planctomycetota bacterium]|nr:hypothetical protein [Planctomycetota bacterium]